MAAKRSAVPMDHPVVVTFLIFAIIGFMSLASEVLKPLALSILLSFALWPIVRRLEGLGVPRAAAVVGSVVGSLVVLGGIIYVVQGQLGALARDLPRYEQNILAKAKWVKAPEDTALDRASKVAERVAETLDTPAIGSSKTVDVRVVDTPTFRQRLEQAVGPILEPLAVLSFVLILVLFILMNREDLNDRMVQLVGHRRVSATTRTMEEVGQRISRYLVVFATFNSCFGLVVGLGLWAIGLPYAVLWGFLAAALRFIPYVGPATAIALPLIFSVAHSPAASFREPLLVLALFGTLEVVANSFLEPVIYGRTTGVSALGLLVAAMFWTWLWGALGLLLSTPMTLCLAVLGKAVPGLGFFATFLGEEAHLPPDLRFYQRLLAFDQDGATAVVDEELKSHSRVDVCDEVLVPALSRAERDFARDEIDDRQHAFAWRVVGDLIEDMEAIDPRITTTATVVKDPALSAARVVGVATNDNADALVLRMLAMALAPSDCTLEVLAAPESPLRLADRVGGDEPDLVVLSHLPPDGLTPARYLVRRLRARFDRLPILVGRWGEQGRADEAASRLTEMGATAVVFRIAEARDRILATLAPEAFKAAQAANTPAAQAPLPDPAAPARPTAGAGVG